LFGRLKVGIDGQLGFLLVPMLWLRFWAQKDFGRSRADRRHDASRKHWSWGQEHGLHSLFSTRFVIREGTLCSFVNFMHQLFNII
jgi:hypothetical protein